MPKTTPETTPGGPPAARWPYPHIVHLTAHAGSGQWRKRCRGKDFYFGPISDPDAALANYLEQWPAIVQRGRKDPNLHPNKRTASGGLGPGGSGGPQLANSGYPTVSDLLPTRGNFGAHQNPTVSHRTEADYRNTINGIIAALGGARPIRSVAREEWLELSRSWDRYSVHRRAKLCVVLRMAIRRLISEGVPEWTFDLDLATDLRPPTARQRRLAARDRGETVWTPAEARAMIGAADDRWRAWMLMGLNFGMGPSDLAELRAGELDLEVGWLSGVRHKTGALRMGPIWPETVEALRRVVTPAKTPPTPAGSGLPLFTGPRGGHIAKALTNRFGPVRDRAGVNRGAWYWWRYTFATVADGAGDTDARKVIMGQVLDGLSDAYVRRFSRERLERVSGRVRAWLFDTPASAPPSAAAET